jgi:hypothetical protein
MQATVAASPLLARYGTPIDPESARELLAKKIAAAAAAASDDDAVRVKAQYDRAVRDMQGGPKTRTTSRSTRAGKPDNPIADILGSRTGQTVVREVLRGIFSTLKRK